MSEVYRRCCGLDVHKQTVVVCVLAPEGSNGKPIKKVYLTFTNNLIRLRVWLKQMKVTEVAMESTGVYWRPVWNVLEGHFPLLLVNPAQVKALAGRKTDQRDCQRIAEFLQDRRLDPSFVPPQPIRELRDLLRHRVALLGDRNRIHNRIHKLLEDANIKLSSVASDLLGVTGRRILRAMVEGQQSAEILSWKARGKMRHKQGLIKESVKGYFTDHHRFLLGEFLEELAAVEGKIARFELEIERCMKPYQEHVDRLSTIPGVDRIVAWSLIAELGVDMTVFPDEAHCASWAGLCPGSHESAGRNLSGRMKKGNRYLRRVLTQAGWANSHRKEGYLTALFHRLAARRGVLKAVMAVAHQILAIAYHILRDKTLYRELGGDYFDRINPTRTTRRLVSRLERLGFDVALQPRPCSDT